MPAEHRYVPSAQLLLLRYHGVVTDDDVVRQTLAVAEDPTVGPYTREFLDAGGMDRADVSPQVLCPVAASKCSLEGGVDPHRVAVVGPREVASGIVQLYRRSCDTAGLPSEVQLFSTAEEALAWLGVPPEALGTG